MSGDIAYGCDLPCDVVKNVSYSPTHIYEMPTANTSLRNQERQLPNEKLCSASLCCHTENINPTKRKMYGIIVISVAISLFIAVGIIASIVDVSRLHAEVPLLRLRPTGCRVELPASNLTRLDMINNNCLENISNSKSIWQCFADQIIAKVTRNTSKTQIAVLIEVLKETGYPFPSCAAIRKLSPFSPSGNYHVISSNGATINAYCDMTRSCGNITGGWMRVAELDMTDSTSQCPSSLELRTSPRRTCGTVSSSSALCSSDMFTVSGVGYSKVCGRITAYQVGTPDAFAYRRSANIETYYVDGVSITHGSPRQHIWTFASAVNEDDQNPNSKCPCINTISRSMVRPPPSFVGEDYFCDTAAITGEAPIFYADDPLWDGAGCGPQSTCCSFNTPPWFYKQLPQPTIDDLEMRVCRDGIRDNEDIAIEVVEIYVQ